MKRLIIFLVRKRLGLKKYQVFRFKNQKSSDLYFFGQVTLLKIRGDGGLERSGVSLNWLLDDECEIEKGDNYVNEIKSNFEIERGD